jgi:hypothetical protein
LNVMPSVPRAKIVAAGMIIRESLAMLRTRQDCLQFLSCAREDGFFHEPTEAYIDLAFHALWERCAKAVTRRAEFDLNNAEAAKTPS